MSDVLKQVEEALEAAVDDLTRCNAMPEREPLFAALAALRGLEWKAWEWAPISDMPEDGGIKCFVGRWAKHGRKWEWLTSEGWGNKKAAMRSGYTHFCRPILPEPPTREVENV